MRVIVQPRKSEADEGTFEIARRRRLRSNSKFYRWFEPWIDEICPALTNKPLLISGLQRDLATAAIGIPWQPAEYLATRRVEGNVIAVVAFGILWYLGASWLWLAAALTIPLFYPRIQIFRLWKAAEARRKTFKRRLAAAIDLMALMLEVGGNFNSALATITQESQDHPLGEELWRVMSDIESGILPKEAWQGLTRRVNDPDVDELVFAIVKGEELGTPLAVLLRTQAEQMRQKRSQWIEKASQEAQVSLVFPAMVIMIACLVIVAAPFIVTAFQESASQ